jgi:hypothetical protein
LRKQHLGTAPGDFAWPVASRLSAPAPSWREMG